MNNENNIKINFDEMLCKIFDLINFGEEEKQGIIKEYNNLVLQQILDYLLEKINNDQDLVKIGELLNENQKNNTEAVLKITYYVNEHLTKEEKEDIYLKSKISVFLELIQPIIENASDDLMKNIGKILSEDKMFYELYKNWMNSKEKIAESPEAPSNN